MLDIHVKSRTYNLKHLFPTCTSFDKMHIPQSQDSQTDQLHELTEHVVLFVSLLWYEPLSLGLEVAAAF